MGVEGSGAKAIRLSPKVLLAMAVALLIWMVVPFLVTHVDLGGILPLFTPKEAFFCAWTGVTRLAVAASCGLALMLVVLALNALVGPTAAWNMSTAGLATAAFAFAAVLGPLSLLGAGSSVCVSPTAIHYRAHSLAGPEVYDRSQIKVVRVSCSLGKKGGFWASLAVAMHDGQTFTLESVNLGALHHRSPSSFPFPRIFEALRDRPWDYTGIVSDCPPELRRHFSHGL